MYRIPAVNSDDLPLPVISIAVKRQLQNCQRTKERTPSKAFSIHVLIISHFAFLPDLRFSFVNFITQKFNFDFLLLLLTMSMISLSFSHIRSNPQPHTKKISFYFSHSSIDFNSTRMSDFIFGPWQIYSVEMTLFHRSQIVTPENHQM